MSSTTQRPIRVLNIIARLNIGGPAVHVTLLTERLNPPEYESLLICGHVGSEEGDMQYYAAQHGVTPLVIPELGRELHPIRDLLTTFKLYRLMCRLKPDVVHTHTAKAGFVGRIAARLAGVPVVVHTFHGHVFKGYFGPFKTALFIALERLTAHFSDTIIALTDGLRRELADTYHIARKSRITVLPLALDLAVFARTPRKTGQFRRNWGIPENAPLIGIVGRLVPIKNHALFLEAAAKVRARYPDARFLIVGDGELRAELEVQVDALHLRGSTTFTSWVRDIAPVYADLDVLVISSRSEGTPLTVIEALSAGCPVVVTEVGGLPDLLRGGELGMLVPPDDADALAAAVTKTVESPPDVRLARSTMLERYDVARLVSDLDSLYRGLLAKKMKNRRSKS